jgi:hypothetical protein
LSVFTPSYELFPQNYAMEIREFGGSEFVLGEIYVDCGIIAACLSVHGEIDTHKI